MNFLVRLCLGLSLILNVCLGLWIASPGRRSKEEPSQEPKASAPTSSPRLSPQGHIESWADISPVTDAEAFRQDLRHLGCPERLIHQVLVATIDREFADRQKVMSTLSPDQFWTSHDERKELTLERKVDLYMLSNERREAIRKATGKSWSVAPSKRRGDIKSAAEMGFFFGFLPPGAADSASALTKSAEVLKDDLDAIADALPKETLQRYRSGVYESFDKDLNALLTPSQRDSMEVMSFGVELLDVNRPDKKFITDLRGTDRMDLLRILKPPDYMKGFVGLETTPPSERHAEIEAALLERFGPEMVEHYRKLEW